MIFDSVVQVGRTITDLVLDHRETSFLQDALTSRICNTPRCSYPPILLILILLITIISIWISLIWRLLYYSLETSGNICTCGCVFHCAIACVCVFVFDVPRLMTF